MSFVQHQETQGWSVASAELTLDARHRLDVLLVKQNGHGMLVCDWKTGPVAHSTHNDDSEQVREYMSHTAGHGGRRHQGKRRAGLPD